MLLPFQPVLRWSASAASAALGATCVLGLFTLYVNHLQCLVRPSGRFIAEARPLAAALSSPPTTPHEHIRTSSVGAGVAVLHGRLRNDAERPLCLLLASLLPIGSFCRTWRIDLPCARIRQLRRVRGNADRLSRSSTRMNRNNINP